MTQPTPSRHNRLPGDLSSAQELERALRVDHAGEYGAMRIYAGQLAVMSDGPAKDKVRKMAEQEALHLETFAKMLSERRIRPTLLAPVWHVAGWVLGAGTAALGEKAAMACTVAVEDVIDEHYRGQARRLTEANDEAELVKTIEKFRAEEIEHRDMALNHGAGDGLGYVLLRAGVGASTRMAIWLSERV
jgi:ubiquinone biosynthesis monooxygenase Coq7